MYSKMQNVCDSSRAEDEESTDDDSEDEPTDHSPQPVRSDLQEIRANIEREFQCIKEEHQRSRTAINDDFRQNVLGHITASTSADKAVTDDTASPCTKSTHGSKNRIDLVYEDEFLKSVAVQKNALLQYEDENSTCTTSSSSSSPSSSRLLSRPRLLSQTRLLGQPRLLNRPRLNEPEEEMSEDSDDSSRQIVELKNIMTAHGSLSGKKLSTYNQAKMSPRYKNLRALHHRRKLGGVLSSDCMFPDITKTDGVTVDRGQQKSSTASLETDLSSRESLRSQNWSYYGLHIPAPPTPDTPPSRYKKGAGPHKGKYTKPKK